MIPNFTASFLYSLFSLEKATVFGETYPAFYKFDGIIHMSDDSSSFINIKVNPEGLDNFETRLSPRLGFGDLLWESRIAAEKACNAPDPAVGQA